MEHNDGYVLSIPVPILRGGSDSNLNTSSDLLLELPRGRLELDSLQQKILKLTEQLKVEQMERDENVAEFLKLVNKADKQQVGRIRQVFEKKNQKLAQSISQLQKKLEQYHRRLKDGENNSSKHSSPKDPFKDAPKDLTKDFTKELTKDTLNVSGSGRHPCLDKIKTIGPGVSLSPPFFFNKPREFANLIRNKFGSADNIAHLKTSLEDSGGGSRALGGSATIVGQTKYHSDDESSTSSSASADSNGNPAAPSQDHTVTEVLDELREIRLSQVRLAEEMEALKEDLKGDTFLTQTLEEERYRVERLEEQLNDLVELHQHEMANLKQELASIEEKVAYQANERARDLQEALESCQTRLSKLEVQQQQQQQAVQVEAEAGRMLLGKGISVLLAVATLLLVCVSTAARFISPILRSRLHLLATALTALLLSLLWRNWEHLQRTLEGTLGNG
ncbi:transmembrane and coiled-coil domain protein 3-like [Salminus brasiliensis]|uniref:transmembrane and coiled-coil domain protein 3-like n=1 Tax=Salminus brasiliensis TaxID=930266 RepID=UPI003B837B67